MKSRSRNSKVSAALFVLPYLLLLIVFGIVPVVYAGVQSFRVAVFEGPTHTGFGNFTTIVRDVRFEPSIVHTAYFVAVWLPLMIIGVLALALLLHARVGRFASTMRLIYFLPGAVTGSAAVLLWLFIAQPRVSPFGAILRFFGFHTSQDVLQQSHLPYLFALMAFTTGAGNWILIMYGALQNLGPEILESATLDGCSAWQSAIHVKLPGIRPYIMYMILLSFALGVQIFVEPQLFYSTLPGSGVSSPWWSPNQLAYSYFFQQSNFGQAAALSVLLLLVSLIGSLLIVFRAKLFDTGKGAR